MIFFGEGSLRNAVVNFLAHYHQERNHQGLNNSIIDPDSNIEQTVGPIKCHQRLGGMLRYYCREAA